jgi:hypothetical protein
MKHRHINDTTWTLAALDSLFERGDLPDRQELHDDLKADSSLRKYVETCAKGHPELQNFIRFFLESTNVKTDS